MDGIREGRVWVDHGGLISGLDARLRSGGREETLGGMLRVRRGDKVDLVVDIDLATGPNWAQFVPKPARVDVIRGAVTVAELLDRTPITRLVVLGSPADERPAPSAEDPHQRTRPPRVARG